MASLEPGKEKEYIRRANAKAWEQYIRCRIDYHDPKYANISEEERQEIDRLNYCIWQECGGYGSPYWYEVFRNEDLEEETIPPKKGIMGKIKDIFKGLRRQESIDKDTKNEYITALALLLKSEHKIDYIFKHQKEKPSDDEVTEVAKKNSEQVS